MVTTSRTTDPSVTELLRAQPYRFDFFQAVRLIERIMNKRASVGETADAANEAARFRTSAAINFPASQLREILWEDDPNNKTGPEMFVNFMGLTGPLGVLPHPYTELIMERRRYKDTAIWHFFDIFNHRVLSLFYRAWKKYRFPIAYERGDDSPFTEDLYCIIGMGTRGLRGRMSRPDEGLLPYGGLIANRPHSASAVAALLSDYFGITARMAQFTGQWLKLEAEDTTKIGRGKNRLGRETIVGTKVWDCQSKFTMQFGPLKFKEFITFLPNGNSFQPAMELIRFLAGMEFDFDLQLILAAAEVPYCRLSSSNKTRMGAMLGWTSWLKTKEFTANDSQVVLTPREHN